MINLILLLGTEVLIHHGCLCKSATVQVGRALLKCLSSSSPLYSTVTRAAELWENRSCVPGG